MNVEGTAAFRRWLVEKVKQSRWARLKSDTIETMAERLGVTPEVLRQAQSELTEESRRLGRRPRQVGAPNRNHGAGLRRKAEVQLPKRVFEDWQAYCEMRKIRPGVMLRSLIHRLLSGPEQPRWLARTCYYRGRTYSMKGAVHGKRWPYVARTDIPPGALRALTRRAAASGTTVAALLRGLILDLLEGRIRRLTVIGSASTMFDDEARYWTLEK